MSNLFHKNVPVGLIDDVFDVTEEVDWHVYQVLTKRSSLMCRYINRRYADRPVLGHIWLGISVEDRDRMGRIRHLKRTNATVRFISIEPLLGSIGSIGLGSTSWAIVGGESSPQARTMQSDWVRELRDQCVEQEVAFFFKQWGGLRSKSGGRDLDGRTWDGFPSALLCSPIAGVGQWMS